MRIQISQGHRPNETVPDKSGILIRLLILSSDHLTISKKRDTQMAKVRGRSRASCYCLFIEYVVLQLIMVWVVEYLVVWFVWFFIWSRKYKEWVIASSSNIYRFVCFWDWQNTTVGYWFWNVKNNYWATFFSN